MTMAQSTSPTPEVRTVVGRPLQPADLTGRLGRAFAAAVPDHPRDDGYFGPASVAWRVAGELSAPVAGLRALLLQALHPLVMAGVDQHSQWREDPVGRLAETSAYLTAVVFGERRAAEHVAARVRRIHDAVRGIDPVTGRAYAASDPVLLLWVHAAFVDSSLAAAEALGAGLSPAGADRYVAEMSVAAELVGVPRDRAPSTRAELRAWMDVVRPELRCTPPAAAVAATLLRPEGLDEDLAAIWRDIADAAVATLPDWAGSMYGVRSEPLTVARRTEARHALGVLDAMLLGEPGVLEARQRITLRIRAARRR